MKTLPRYPCLKNLVAAYNAEGGRIGTPQYVDWLRQFGFKVPVEDNLEFPDDFPDQELFLFILRWS